MYKTILVCSDGSEHSLKAVQQATSLAKQADACLLLLNVHDSMKEMLPCIMPWQLELGNTPPAPPIEAEQEAILSKTAKLLEDAHVRYSCLREHGHPADAIVHVAQREGVDLIVVGCRGLSGLQSLLLGGVSNHVVHHAHCSVLVVR